MWLHVNSVNRKGQLASVVHSAAPSHTPLRQVVCNRAAAAAKLGRHQDALADAEEAIQLDASYAKAYVRRAQVRCHAAWRCSEGVGASQGGG